MTDCFKFVPAFILRHMPVGVMNASLRFSRPYSRLCFPHPKVCVDVDPDASPEKPEIEPPTENQSLETLG